MLSPIATIHNNNSFKSTHASRMANKNEEHDTTVDDSSLDSTRTHGGGGGSLVGLLPECQRRILSFLTLKEALNYKSVCRQLHHGNDVYQYSHLFRHDDYYEYASTFHGLLPSFTKRCFQEYVKAQNMKLVRQCALGRGTLRDMIRNDNMSFELLLEIVQEEGCLEFEFM
jgi:hypothetical protein